MFGGGAGAGADVSAGGPYSYANEGEALDPRDAA